MYPDAKDQHEAQNVHTKRSRPSQCQFTQSEAALAMCLKPDNAVPEQVRPQTAQTEQLGAIMEGKIKQKKFVGDVKKNEINGSMRLAHPERNKKFSAMTRDERQQAVIAIHCSSQMANIIHKAKDKDVTSGLAHAKQTAFSTYKPSMGPAVATSAQKAPPVWRNF